MSETEKPVTQWTFDFILKNPNRAITAFLTSSYIYYHREDLRPLMSDHDFDLLCSFILKNFDKFEHPHFHLVRKDSLAAGTGFDIPESAYPSITKSLAIDLSLGLHSDTSVRPKATKVRRRRTKSK